MKITEHFTLEEFNQPGTRSYPAHEYPLEWVDERLRPLCEVLEKVREKLGGKAIHIISGYRSPEFNKAIGGAPNSQHMQGRAADIVVSGTLASVVYAAVKQMVDGGEIRLGGLGKYDKFNHLDIRTNKKIVLWDETTKTPTVPV